MHLHAVVTPETRRALGALLRGPGGVVRVVQGDRWVAIDVRRDGVSSWLLRATGEHGQHYFDCGGQGIVGLNADVLVELVAKCFKHWYVPS